MHRGDHLLGEGRRVDGHRQPRHILVRLARLVAGAGRAGVALGNLRQSHRAANPIICNLGRTPTEAK
jgi:hypothetical protein